MDGSVGDGAHTISPAGRTLGHLEGLDLAVADQLVRIVTEVKSVS